jgi:hypothetical protein
MDSAADEKRLADAMKFLEFGCRDPEFKATMLRKILYFTGEDTRMAILILSFQEMDTKIQRLKKCDANRGQKFKNSGADSRPSVH